MFGAWSYVAAGALVLALLGGTYQTGYNAAMRKAQVATITAERDAARLDLATARKAADQAAAQASELAATADTNQAKVKELADALAKADKSGGACRLGDYARRLRDIR